MKPIKHQSGIYQITNIVNGHRYIGSAVDLHQRWQAHQSRLRRHCHVNKHLQGAWDQYGRDAFEWSILCLCDRENLYLFEQWFLDLLQPEYNISPRADHPIGMGHPHTDESRRKLSAAHKGKVLSEEHKQKLSEAHKGKRPNRIYGPRSEETKQKISATHKACGKRPPSFKGHKQTAEALAKQSASMRATLSKMTPEQRMQRIAPALEARKAKREAQHAAQ